MTFRYSSGLARIANAARVVMLSRMHTSSLAASRKWITSIAFSRVHSPRARLHELITRPSENRAPHKGDYRDESPARSRSSAGLFFSGTTYSLVVSARAVAVLDTARSRRLTQETRTFASPVGAVADAREYLNPVIRCTFMTPLARIDRNSDEIP